MSYRSTISPRSFSILTVLCGWFWLCLKVVVMHWWVGWPRKFLTSKFALARNNFVGRGGLSVRHMTRHVVT